VGAAEAGGRVGGFDGDGLLPLLVGRLEATLALEHAGDAGVGRAFGGVALDDALEVAQGPLGLADAEQQGRAALVDLGVVGVRGAADLGERALSGETELPLARLRAAYRSLFDLRARVATTRDLANDMSQKPGDRDPLDKALDVAARAGPRGGTRGTRRRPPPRPVRSRWGCASRNCRPAAGSRCS